ncbi:uncharacterized protein CC84DRAFT_1198197 [Paraphaeosphaeria sporulosa]|uniref:lytic cellulose monooxygenase (C4-dehydrogenating) n=1 Tax=Paraphaeosphaeria sporulosa TaxID=1460663 RepID=A0A177C8X7_9PLEO|nr:uncharacterized protein CC84DRAFT_1198197 [Paraphaeosphaeria sporulosa]OAG03312.1 hypothetical protein CC84DRAFT_1198197 [Paraphaeosphaeria sporulosa]
MLSAFIYNRLRASAIVHILCKALVAALATTCYAHWTYDRIIVNGQVIGEPWQYVRRHSNGNNFLSDVTSNDMRCNINGGVSGSNTSTYAVQVGDLLGFTIRDTFGHPGPQQVYISKAPAAVKDYDGSGEWAKIYTLSNCVTKGCGTGDGIVKWATYRAQTFNFKLPAETPAGEYLLRAEGLAIHAAQKSKGAQFYVACAQIKVMGNGTGLPAPTIRIPGEYTENSTGILIPMIWSKITDYTSPGPRLWPEGTEEAHMLDGKVKESDSRLAIEDKVKQ